MVLPFCHPTKNVKALQLPRHRCQQPKITRRLHSFFMNQPTPGENGSCNLYASFLKSTDLSIIPRLFHVYQTSGHPVSDQCNSSKPQKSTWSARTVNWSVASSRDASRRLSKITPRSLSD